MRLTSTTAYVQPHKRRGLGVELRPRPLTTPLKSGCYGTVWWHFQLQTGRMKLPSIILSKPRSTTAICCSSIDVKRGFPTPMIFSRYLCLSLTNKLLANSLNKTLPRSAISHNTTYIIIKSGQQYGGDGRDRLFISGYYGNENAL